MKKKPTLLLLLPIATLLLSGCADDYCISKYYKDDSTYIRRNFYSEGCPKKAVCEDFPIDYCAIAMKALKEQPANDAEIEVYYGHREVGSASWYDTKEYKNALEKAVELNIAIVRTISSTSGDAISKHYITIDNFDDNDVIYKKAGHKECHVDTFDLYDFNTSDFDNINFIDLEIKEGTIKYSYIFLDDPEKENYSDLYSYLFIGYEDWNKPIYFSVEDDIVTLS